MADRFAYCPVSIAPLRAEATDRSEIVSQVLFGEIVTVHQVEAPWAHITTMNDAYSGYVDHKHLRYLTEKEVRRWNDGKAFLPDREALLATPWGMQRICRGAQIHDDADTFIIGNDTFKLHRQGAEVPASPVAVALDYLNTPYLWGGKSPFGIDCSGIIQVIFRLFDYNLPRDASEQVAHGTEIEWTDRQIGDLAFFHNSSGVVTHVGILDTLDTIIHASGWVRQDILTETGIIHKEHGGNTHALTCIRRL